MEITTTTVNRNPGRRAAVNALAIVGFIALIIIGIGLAIYSASSFPKLTSKIGGAAVSLSSVFRGKDTEPASLQVITATSTLPIDDAVVATSTEIVATTTKPTGTKTPTSHTTYQTVTVTQEATPYGDPDLYVTITDIGYLRTDGDTDTFESANLIDNDKDGAVKFTITNIGTNVTGAWKFKAEIPSSPSQNFTSPNQDSLKPGDSIDYVLGFEKGKKGDNREITITVDPSNTVHESNENNNVAYDSVNIKD
jgi:hypothetical protein